MLIIQNCILKMFSKEQACQYELWTLQLRKTPLKDVTANGHHSKCTEQQMDVTADRRYSYWTFPLMNTTANKRCSTKTKALIEAVALIETCYVFDCGRGVIMEYFRNSCFNYALLEYCNQRRSSRPPNPPIGGGPRPTLGAQVSLKLLFGYVTIFSSADLFTTDLNCRKKLACDIISECYVILSPRILNIRLT